MKGNATRNYRRIFKPSFSLNRSREISIRNVIEYGGRKYQLFEDNATLVLITCSTGEKGGIGSEISKTINLKKEAETKVDSLVSSKSDLEGKLTQLNSRLQALSAENIAHAPVKIVPIADIEALAKNFSVASFNAELKKTPPHVDNSYIELAGNTKTVLEWLLDKELSQKANDAIAQFRQAGPGFIPAQMAYERLMKKAIGTGVGLTPEQGEQIVQQVSSRGLSSQAPAEAAAKKPGFLMSTIFGGAKHAGHAAGKAAEKGKGGLSKIWGYLWEDV